MYKITNSFKNVYLGENYLTAIPEYKLLLRQISNSEIYVIWARATKKDTYIGQMLYTGEVIFFVPSATHGHKMIYEQMKHISNMR